MMKDKLDSAGSTPDERAELILNSIGDAVLSIDIQGNVTYLNVVAEAMTGWSREAAAGRSLREVFRIIDGDTREPAQDPTNFALHVDSTVGLKPNCILVRRDGVEAAIEDSTAPIRDKDGQVVGAVIVFRTVGAALERSRQMSHLAHHDALTGLPNRPLLHDRLRAAMALGLRHNKPLAVLFVDVDGFKGINDSIGHAGGDQLLCSIATRLTAALRASDTVSRFGGDEFVVVLSEVEHSDDAATVAWKLLRAVSTPHFIDGHDVSVTASIGLALYPGHGLTAGALIDNADTAMFAAKQAGQNTYRFFHKWLNNPALELRPVDAALGEALGRNEFELCYQPWINLDSGAITGLEAFLRWRHPQRGPLPAAQFVTAAEQAGLMVPIGRWALHVACRQARSWQDAGLQPVATSVNISAVEFWRPDFLDDVQKALQDTGLQACYLALEVTEDVLMQAPPAAVGILTALGRLGVQVAIDQFGTGQSSLIDLLQFPIDVLKVDQSFVRAVGPGVTAAPALAAIVALARSVNRRVVATGVETHWQLAFLRAKECPEAQGHLFGPALSPAALGELLKSGVLPGRFDVARDPTLRIAGDT